MPWGYRAGRQVLKEDEASHNSLLICRSMLIIEALQFWMTAQPCLPPANHVASLQGGGPHRQYTGQNTPWAMRVLGAFTALAGLTRRRREAPRASTAWAGILRPAWDDETGLRTRGARACCSMASSVGCSLAGPSTACMTWSMHADMNARGVTRLVSKQAFWSNAMALASWSQSGPQKSMAGPRHQAKNVPLHMQSMRCCQPSVQPRRAQKATRPSTLKCCVLAVPRLTGCCRAAAAPCRCRAPVAPTRYTTPFMRSSFMCRLLPSGLPRPLAG